MKWDVKHDRAKKVIDHFLDNAGYWQELEDLVAGLTDEEKDLVHVLYAVKIYNTEDELTAVQFYMNPMSDVEFEKVAGKGRGTMIYALHSRKVKAAG